jgi:hypothetical protein
LESAAPSPQRQRQLDCRSSREAATIFTTRWAAAAPDTTGDVGFAGDELDRQLGRVAAVVLLLDALSSNLELVGCSGDEPGAVRGAGETRFSQLWVRAEAIVSF